MIHNPRFGNEHKTVRFCFFRRKLRRYCWCLGGAFPLKSRLEGTLRVCGAVVAAGEENFLIEGGAGLVLKWLKSEEMCFLLSRFAR